MRVPRLARIAALAATLWGWIACSPPGESGAAAAAASPSAGEWITARYWVAGCSVPDDLWRYRKGSSTVSCDPRGRTLGERDGAFVWPDYLPAADVETVTVEGEALDGLRFELFWSGDDSFSPDRSARPAAAPSSREVRFDVAAAPEWRGLVRRFKLVWSGTPSHASRITGAWGRRRAGSQ